MSGALTRLLEGIVDYAGLFPPAKLPMAESVANYMRYIDGPEQWILSRFICPSSRLAELSAELRRRPNRQPVSVSVIGPAAADRNNWEDGLETAAQDMTRFEEEAQDLAEIEAMEIRVPDIDNLDTYLRDLVAFESIDMFVELPWSGDLDAALMSLAETDWMGAKARTGGLDAAAFPSSEALAAFLQQCAHLDLDFKLTAGLHHPIRTHDSAIGVDMHGFVNVLTALVFESAHDLTRREIQTILDEKDPAAFEWGEHTVRWKDLKAGEEHMDAARQLFVGFGSCSVDEPLHDLHKLGLVRAAVL